jgi:hypothetical protein
MGDPDELDSAANRHASEIERLREIGAPDHEIKRETMLAKRTLMRAILARRLSTTTLGPLAKPSILAVFAGVQSLSQSHRPGFVPCDSLSHSLGWCPT